METLVYPNSVYSLHVHAGKPERPKGVNSDLPFSWAYVTELLCTLVYSLTFASDLAVKGVLHITGDRIYGYTIIVDVLGVVAWLSSVLLIYQEKAKVVTSKPHGCILVLFWMVGVVVLGSEVMSYDAPYWWWNLASRADIADLALFCIRAVFLSVLVMVGVLRPLCWPSRRRAYSLLINADTPDNAAGEDVEDGKTARKRREGDFIKNRTSSTFANMWTKIRLLFPYVWPKGEHNHRLCFFSCVANGDDLIFMCVCVSGEYV